MPKTRRCQVRPGAPERPENIYFKAHIIYPCRLIATIASLKVATQPRLWLALLLIACNGAAAEVRQFRFESQTGEAVSNVVVTAGPAAGPADDVVAIMDQKSKAFRPYVLPVRVGTEVSFPNSDQIRHHVYSFSPAKRFEIRLYHGEPGETVTFDEPGIVALGCNIHDNMVGYIYVTEAVSFGRTNASGEVQLNLPPGTQMIRAWHPALSFDARRELDLPLAELMRDDDTYVVGLGIESPPEDPQAIDPDARDRFRRYLPE
ncbi:MAG: methylamine utilization protein [Gammaproteobacteria bacterium]|nr:methylamine utilization protein [Gammaproteobacteria bacterium]